MPLSRCLEQASECSSHKGVREIAGLPLAQMMWKVFLSCLVKAHVDLCKDENVAYELCNFFLRRQFYSPQFNDFCSFWHGTFAIISMHSYMKEHLLILASLRRTFLFLTLIILLVGCWLFILFLRISRLQIWPVENQDVLPGSSWVQSTLH